MKSIGYLELLKTNKQFRRLWSASVVSMLGEWFNTIALFLLIFEYTESEFLLGILFTVRMLCFALLQPISGLLADRMNRKHIMIASNFIQIFLALCFLGVNGPEDIGWMLGLSGVMMLLHGAYVTAERAALPNIVSKENLATANALDAASWSSALCIGAMLGGVVVELYGVEAAFIIDALTFLLGTVLLIPLTLPQTIGEEMDGPLLSTAVSNIKKGLRRILDESRLLRVVFAKASWNIAGGGLAGVFLVVAGSDVDGFGAAIGFGLFFFARGIGTGLGPILARRFLTNEEQWPFLIGLLVVVSGFFYLIVGLTLGVNVWLTVILVMFAHSASGGNWVLSTILTQRWVEDEIRGRVFSIDMLTMSIAFSASSATAGYLLENGYLTLQSGFQSFAVLMMISGIVFTLWRPDRSRQNTQTTIP
ncbi:MFS transporter [Candidatus Poseidoniaceae archaeon]|nr:MFS transporter [Euryarchaeota archaeon]MDA9166455.1 MFS transporter [Candidatus Poseidoniaceae archaeon]MDA8568282.1 MFS transporter [Euryarchaeota archaeon]MDA8609787.1 MFS transporter [Euryarchaeota archaeon]MDA8727675.1 MFS transporter [Euryarchaeota archaeon]